MKDRPNTVIALLMIIAVMTGCSRKFGIQREIVAKDGRGIEAPGGSCRSTVIGDVEITVEPVVYAEWRNILAYPPYTARPEGADVRLPRLSIFQCVIRNRGDRAVPLSDIRFSLSAGDVEFKELALSDIEKRLASPAYRGFNFRNLFAWKRLFGTERCSDAIHYERDITDYRFDFLAPGDSLVRMVAMDWLPVRCREMSLGVELSTGAVKKSIDFEFTREEYRTRGKHFTGPDMKGDGGSR